MIVLLRVSFGSVRGSWESELRVMVFTFRVWGGWCGGGGTEERHYGFRV